jgi:hypothetical protein
MTPVGKIAATLLAASHSAADRRQPVLEQGEPPGYRRMLDMRFFWYLSLAAISLGGCGDVKSGATDAAQSLDGTGSAGGDAAPNPCAPDTCLLFDDFSGPRLDTSLWAMTTSNGATVTQANGVLTLRIPAAAANATVDVYSLAGFPVGATFEASVTFSAGQAYDHKGVGFASSPVSHQCTVGETDAAMFRGQDQDSYVETKAAGAYTCKTTATMYMAGTHKLQITRAADQVTFRRDDIALPPSTTNLPAGLLPVRFSAYSFTDNAPLQPVQIDIDYVFVRRPKP